MKDYTVLAQIKATTGGEFQRLGEHANCRFCGCTDPKNFRMKAHTFPEALGNKRVFSLNECNECNSKFGRYEDALAKAIGPLLTLGGVHGKNGVRQNGRTKSGVFIKHSVGNDRRRLSVRSKGDITNIFTEDHLTGRIQLTMPIEGDKYIPQYAFKALCKMACMRR
ncbi:MAG: hypothetical protein O3A51_11790 [Verrucomicrobia bacterium]|nr:hypothetical protein [Verrucomicrobiota bacterium]